MTEEQLEIPEEFTHVDKVLINGAIKYGPNSWIKGNHFDVHKNHKSMSHHLLESYREIRIDHESGLDPLLHLACRALMEYTLRKRGLINELGHVTDIYNEVPALGDTTNERINSLTEYKSEKIK
jgi:hypothetical protein